MACGGHAPGTSAYAPPGPTSSFRGAAWRLRHHRKPAAAAAPATITKPLALDACFRCCASAMTQRQLHEQAEHKMAISTNSKNLLYIRRQAFEISHVLEAMESQQETLQSLYANTRKDVGLHAVGASSLGSGRCTRLAVGTYPCQGFVHSPPLQSQNLMRVLISLNCRPCAGCSLGQRWVNDWVVRKRSRKSINMQSLVLKHSNLRHIGIIRRTRIDGSCRRKRAGVMAT